MAEAKKNCVRIYRKESFSSVFYVECIAQFTMLYKTVQDCTRIWNGYFDWINVSSFSFFLVFSCTTSKDPFFAVIFAVINIFPWLDSILLNDEIK